MSDFFSVKIRFLSRQNVSVHDFKNSPVRPEADRAPHNESSLAVRPEADRAPHTENYLTVRPEEARSLRRLEG
jgi:hypothetical protein